MPNVGVSILPRAVHRPIQPLASRTLSHWEDRSDMWITRRRKRGPGLREGGEEPLLPRPDSGGGATAVSPRSSAALAGRGAPGRGSCWRSPPRRGPCRSPSGPAGHDREREPGGIGAKRPERRWLGLAGLKGAVHDASAEVQTAQRGGTRYASAAPAAPTPSCAIKPAGSKYSRMAIILPLAISQKNASLITTCFPVGGTVPRRVCMGCVWVPSLRSSIAAVLPVAILLTTFAVMSGNADFKPWK
jgi:hypothetical protein